MHDVFAQASALRRAGKTLAAIDLYHSYLKSSPQDRIAWHNLGAALGDEGMFKQAAHACEKAILLGLDAAETWLVLARAHQANGDLGKAQRAYEKSLDRKPSDLVALRDHAQLLWMQTGQADLALSRLKDALNHNPQDLGIRLSLSKALGQMGQHAESLNEAQRAASLAPNSDTVQILAANAALSATNFDLAIDYARKATSIAPESKAAMLTLAQALIATGDAGLAQKTLESLAQTHPNDQYVVAMLATVWRLLNDARYDQLYNYTRLVRGYSLSCPNGWNSLERYVDDLREALLERHHFLAHPFDQSVKGAGSQITHIERITENPAFSAWPEATLPALRNYAKQLNHASDILQSDDQHLIQRYKTWSVQLKQTGHHTDHVHPDGLISSACHIHTPASIQHGPDGWLRFGKPGIATQPELEAEYFHRPEAGVIVFFPSYMWHGVSTFQDPGTRLTIAMDIEQN